MPSGKVILPAEWAPAERVLITWPHDGHVDWADALPAIEPVYEALARALAARAGLLVVARDDRHAGHVRDRLAAAGVDVDRALLARAASDDIWARDYGPITVFCDGGPLRLDFRFNAWGGKYPWQLDDAVTGQLHDAGVLGDAPLKRIDDLILEGGAMDSDGQGTLLTTRACLLDPRRNPGMDAAEMAARLGGLLGARRIHWLTRGKLEGDDTDGHVDNLARFADAATIVHQGCGDSDDPHHAELNALAGELATLRRADGRPYRLIELPLPEPVYASDGARLPASYANFLICNGAVIVPTYDCAQDESALRALGEAFPRHVIVPLPCRNLVRGGGSLHCATMQIPSPAADSGL